MHYEAGMIATN